MRKFYLALGFVAALVMAPVRAAADPITALFTAVQTFAAASVVNAFIVRFATGVILSALGAAVARSRAPDAQAQGGIKTTATTGGSVNPQSFILGIYATSANMPAPPYSHPNSGGAPNKFLTYVMDVSDLPVDGLQRLIVNGAYLDDIAAADPADDLDFNARFVDGKAHVSFTFYDGRQTAADPYMMANYSSQANLPWAADMIGVGVSYAVLRFRYNRELFNGLPSVRFEVRGVALYDPRFDGSVGGSGAQRFNDPDTWEFTENPIVMIYNILRGIEFPDGAVWGGDARAQDLPLANWFTAMNACDLEVTLADGSLEPAYRAGLEVKVSEEPAAVIQELLNACSAEIVEIGGLYKVRVGPVAIPAYVFTDREIMVDGPRQLIPHPGIGGLINGVEARFPSPEALWETDDAPARYNAAWETEDGGRRLVSGVELSAVPFPVQVQRLMLAWARDARRFRVHNVALPPAAAVLEPLDGVAWSSTRHGYTSKVFEVGEISDDFLSLVQAVSIREREAGDFVWVAGNDQLPVVSVERIVTAPGPRAIAGFGFVSRPVIDASGGARAPGFRLTWDASDVDDLDGIEYQVRPFGRAEIVAQGTFASVREGALDIYGFVLPGVQYQARVRPVIDRASVWSDWLTATASDDRLTIADLDPIVLAAIDEAEGFAVQAADFAFAARTTAANLLPSDFLQDSDFWSQAVDGPPATKPDTLSDVTYLDDPARGRVASVNFPLASVVAIAPKGYIANPVAGRTYELQVTARHVGPLPASPPAFYFSSVFRKLDGNHAFISTASFASHTFSAGDVSEVFTNRYEFSGAAAAFLTVFPRVNPADYNPASGAIVFEEIRIRDITDIVTAEQFAIAATNAAGDADLARAQAVSASTDAGASLVQAVDALDLAVAARDVATGAASAAGVSQTNAAQAAVDAEGAATSAALSQTSVTSQLAAAMPSDFAQDGLYWASGLSGAPDAIAPLNNKWTFGDLGAGRAAITSPDGTNLVMVPKGVLPFIAGDTYKITIRFRHDAGGQVGATRRMFGQFRWYDSAYNDVSSQSVLHTFNNDTGVQEVSFEYTAPVQSAAYMRGLTFLPSSYNDAAVDFYILSQKFENITQNGKADVSLLLSATSTEDQQTGIARLGASVDGATSEIVLAAVRKSDGQTLSGVVIDSDSFRFKGALALFDGTLEGSFTAGSNGWQIKDDGSAEFNDVTIRRQIEVASGTLVVPNFSPNLGSSGNDFVLGRSAFVDATPIQLTAWQAPERTYLVTCGMSGATVGGNGNEPNVYFGWTGTVLPLTRWNGNQTLRLKFDFWHRSVSFVQNCTLTWKIYEVS